jgi:hypothetical protein
MKTYSENLFKALDEIQANYPEESHRINNLKTMLYIITLTASNPTPENIEATFRVIHRVEEFLTIKSFMIKKPNYDD